LEVIANGNKSRDDNWRSYFIYGVI
jgi:hypothetical protein